MTFLSRRDLSTVLAACAVLVAPVLVAGPQSPASVEQTQPSPPPDAPRIAVEPPSFDFGKVLPEKALSREFAIRNFGKQDLVVDNVSTSCGCTVTDPPPPVKMVLKPGASQPLRVTLTTPANPGRISKSVLVKSNDPDHAVFEIKLQATVVAAAP
jgi:uncharacterized protein DUF1573